MLQILIVFGLRVLDPGGPWQKSGENEDPWEGMSIEEARSIIRPRYKGRRPNDVFIEAMGLADPVPTTFRALDEEYHPGFPIKTWREICSNMDATTRSQVSDRIRMKYKKYLREAEVVPGCLYFDGLVQMPTMCEEDEVWRYPPMFSKLGTQKKHEEQCLKLVDKKTPRTADGPCFRLFTWLLG